MTGKRDKEERHKKININANPSGILEISEFFNRMADDNKDKDKKTK